MNILKRVLVHVSGFNLGLIMRRLLGVGTPRGLQGRAAALIALLATLWRTMATAVTGRPRGDVFGELIDTMQLAISSSRHRLKTGTCTTGC